MKILSLFDYTGNMVQPWADAGHDCWTIDIQHQEHVVDVENVGTGSIHKFNLDMSLPKDIRMCLGAGWDMVFAFPPCTDLASSGAKHFATKGLKRFIDALQLVQNTIEICEASGAPWMIENPVGRISTAWRKPDHYFHPWEYSGYLSPEGDGYTKKTCLWTGGGFIMPEKKPFTGEIDTKYIHHCPPGPNRANIRSATPMGFAQAVFEANKPIEDVT